MLVRYLRGAHDDARHARHPERLERRTRAIARLGGLIPPALLERSLAARKALTRAPERRARRPRRADHAGDRRAAAADRRAAGRGALWTLNAVAGWVPYNGVWNVTGQPAAAVPAGFGDDGLPLAVQLVGRPDDEGTLLSLAAQLEAARPWADSAPAGFA